MSDAKASRLLAPLLTLLGVGLVLLRGRPTFGVISPRLCVWALVVAGHALSALVTPARGRAAAWAPPISLVVGVALLSWPVPIAVWVVSISLLLFLAGYALRSRTPFGELLLVVAAMVLLGHGPAWGWLAALLCWPLVAATVASHRAPAVP